MTPLWFCFASATGWETTKTDFDIIILNPLGNSVVVNRVFKDVPLVMGGAIFLSNLLVLKSNEFDVILGMD